MRRSRNAETVATLGPASSDKETVRADWIALSFVQRPEDVAEARALIGDRAAIA